MRHTAPKARGWALLLFIFGLAALVSSCGGDGGNDGAGNAGGNAPGQPLPGPADALAASVIEDVLIDEEVGPDEYSEDGGNAIQRTSIKIVFHDDTTVGEVNDLLIELSADIIATLAQYPAVVVRIPDPGTLQALETLITDLESRGAVRSVLRSILPNVRSLPPNHQQKIFNTGNPDPIFADEWKTIDHHLAIRAAAAWNIQSLVARKPSVLVLDHFGSGAPGGELYDIERLAGQPDFGFKIVQRSPLCDTPPLDAGLVCNLPDSHGYGMLSIIAAKHSSAARQGDADFATGMVPGGIRLGVYDLKGANPLARDMDMFQQLKAAADASPGTVIVNMSIGRDCVGTALSQLCIPKEKLTVRVIEFIRFVRHIDVEDRALFVVAAGNRELNAAKTMFIGPADAATHSEWTASALLDDLVDSSTQEAVKPLTNVLVVENAEQDFSVTPPFNAGCITDESFVGGHIAGVGQDVYMIGRPPINPTSNVSAGGTSSATAQLSGVAAYLAALDPDLTPQQLITILTATAEPLPGEGKSCTALTTTTPVVDAYAAVLATDPPRQLDPSSAKARLELLDIFPDDQRDGDGVFDIQDLRLWIFNLTTNLDVDGEGQINYGRYDLNGDGHTGGTSVERFDLDISLSPTGAGASPFDIVRFDFLGEPVTYLEEELTDMQIVCYYANSNLFDLSGLGASVRDNQLEAVRSLCDPCAALTDPANGGAGVKGLASAQADAEGTCEEVSKITYLFFSGGIKDIAVMNVDGSNRENLTNSESDDVSPAWSPDGATIAFASRRDGNSEIYVMDADGSNPRNLTTDASNDIDPSWSPDGLKIAFASERDGNFEIYVMDADGSTPQRLTNDASSDLDPSWSPDGTRIAFVSGRDGSSEIYVMDANGANPQNLTSDASGDFDPSWSPDGSQIAFSSQRDGNSEIYVMGANGANPQNLTSDASGDFQPSWSPDGTQIAFSTTRDGTPEIYAMEADGSNPQNLTNFGSNDQHPSWSP